MVFEASRRFPRLSRLPRHKSTEERIKELKEEQKKEGIRNAFSRLDEALSRGFLERTMVAPTKHDDFLTEYEDSHEYVELFQIGDITVVRDKYISRKKKDSRSMTILLDRIGSESSKYYILRNNSLVTNEEEIKSILKKITRLKFLTLKFPDYLGYLSYYDTNKEIVTKISPYDKPEDVKYSELQPKERDIQEQLSYAEMHLKQCLTEEFGFRNTNVAVKNAEMLKTVIDKYKTYPAH